jgi:hypothetical protein
MHTWMRRYGLLLLVFGCLTACGHIPEAAAPTGAQDRRHFEAILCCAPRRRLMRKPLDRTSFHVFRQPQCSDVFSHDLWYTTPKWK